LLAPDSVLLHGWLCQAARLYGDRPAAVTDEESITIGELWARAGAIAGTLVRLGVQRGDRVAIVLAKSIDALTALYGILAAGAVYVPVAPQWPRARLDAALEHCGARAMIWRPDGDAAAPVIVDLRSSRNVLWADALHASPERDPGQNVRPSDPAFILYTSGSTGSPKGVTISHQAVGAFVDWTAETFCIGPDDRLLCPAPLGFDLSTFDVLNIARSASTCVIVGETVSWVPRFLCQFARDHRVTVWYSVPSLLARLLNDSTFGREPLETLRTILFAGEVMPIVVVSPLRQSYPRADVCNLYGPTETNVVTWHRLPCDVDPSRPIPIGIRCPYAGLRVDPADAVRSDDGSTETGQLLVSGDSLMTGYWGRAEETARAFVHFEEAGRMVRYYRTGDRVTISAHGVVDFLGRVDRQVKRRGFRIELAEIEAALARSTDVAEAAVTAEGEGAATVIRAFVRLRPGAVSGTIALRAHCAAILPSEELPDDFVVLDTLPRGNRGKIDYQALARVGHRSG
jgi:amino acid adenylation domain-containing protein